MAQAGLPANFWAEAVATAAYLRNRMVTRSLKEKITPYEKWYDRKPNLAHLRAFEYMAYAYVPDSSRRGKLSKKAEKLRFIGYYYHTKGYCLVDETTSKVIMRQNIIFNESDFNKDGDASGSVNCFDDDVFSDEELVLQPPNKLGQQDDQTRYPRRQKCPPVRYGVDEYVDMAF